MGPAMRLCMHRHNPGELMMEIPNGGPARGLGMLLADALGLENLHTHCAEPIRRRRQSELLEALSQVFDCKDRPSP